MVMMSNRIPLFSRWSVTWRGSSVVVTVVGYRSPFCVCQIEGASLTVELLPVELDFFGRRLK